MVSRPSFISALAVAVLAAPYSNADHDQTRIEHKTLQQNPYQPTWEQGVLRRSGAALIVEDRPHVLWVRHNEAGIEGDVTRILGQQLGFPDAYPSQPTGTASAQEGLDQNKPIVEPPAPLVATPDKAEQSRPALKKLHQRVLRDGYYGKEFETPPDAALSVTELEMAGYTHTDEPPRTHIGVDEIISGISSTEEHVADRALISKPRLNPDRSVPATTHELKSGSVTDNPERKAGKVSPQNTRSPIIDLAKWEEPEKQDSKRTELPPPQDAPSLQELSTLVDLACDHKSLSVGESVDCGK